MPRFRFGTSYGEIKKRFGADPLMGGGIREVHGGICSAGGLLPYRVEISAKISKLGEILRGKNLRRTLAGERRGAAAKRDQSAAIHLPLTCSVSMPVIFCLLPSSSIVILVLYLFSTDQ